MAETKPTNEEIMAAAITKGIAEGLAKLVPVLRPQDPLEAAGLSPERIAQIRTPPQPKRWRLVAVRFPTGATAVANVVESSKFKGGRITSFTAYRHPPEAYAHEDEGGRVPTGFPIWRGGQALNIAPDEEPANGSLDPVFLQWRYETFWKRDLTDFIGAELTAPLCAEPEGMQTPWQKGHVLVQALAA
jgi:hypothetical protein